MSEPDKPHNLYEAEHAVAGNARMGLVLFFIYCAVYAGFVGLCAFSLKTMELPVFGVNLAIVYGFGLIGFAFVLALIYTFLCKPSGEKADRS